MTALHAVSALLGGVGPPLAPVGGSPAPAGGPLAATGGPSALFDDPAVGSALGALAATTVIAALVVSLYTRSAIGADRDDAPARVRRALAVALPAAYLLALAALVAAGWFDLLDDAVGWFPGTWRDLGATVVIVAGLTVPAVAAAGAYLGALPALAGVRDDGLDAPAVARSLGRGVVGLVAVLTFLVVGVTAADPDAANGLGAAGTGVVLGGLLLVGSPRVVRVFRATRAPTADERERIAALCADVGCAPAATWVVETGDADATAFLRGVPGRRHLFVAEPLLADRDDDGIRTHLALGAARARTLHPEAKAVAVLGPVAAAAALAAGTIALPGVAGPVAAGVVLVGSVVGLRLGQRLVYRADADAARRTSHVAVVRAIRNGGLGGSTDWGLLTALRRMEPPAGRRLERLREGAGEG